MSVKTIYRCDICRGKIKNRTELLGVYFTGMKNFTLGGYGCTEGVHICYGCARQLKKELNQIGELVETADND